MLRLGFWGRVLPFYVETGCTLRFLYSLSLAEILAFTVYFTQTRIQGAADIDALLLFEVVYL